MNEDSEEPDGQKMAIDTDPNFYLAKREIDSQIEEAAKNGASKFVLIFKPIIDKIPRSYPKLVKDSLKEKVTNIKKVNEVVHARNGNLLVITECVNTAKELGKTKNIIGKQVETSVQTESITSRFLLFDITTDTTLAELKEDLEEENQLKIHNIRRFTKKTDKGVIQTRTVLITCLGRFLPEYIKLWMTRQKITLFVDRPRQCTNCWSYEHNTKLCSKTRKCLNCGEDHHQSVCQTTNPKCCLCGDHHKADSEICTKHLKEREILQFKAENGVSITEARRVFRNKAQSYARAVKALPEEKPKETNNKELIEIFQKMLEEQRNHFTLMLEAVTNKFVALIQESNVNTKTLIQESLRDGSSRETKDSNPPAPKKPRITSNGGNDIANPEYRNSISKEQIEDNDPKEQKRDINKKIREILDKDNGKKRNEGQTPYNAQETRMEITDTFTPDCNAGKYLAVGIPSGNTQLQTEGNSIPGSQTVISLNNLKKK